MKDQPKRAVLQAHRVVGGFFGAIGRILATLIMVCIITGCIVASVLTVYIFKYVGSDDEISLDNIKMGYTSIIYAYNEKDEPYELQRLYYEQNRIWLDYDRITQYTKDAIVAVEDKRFWEHDGVDWKRTAAAGVNMFIPIYSTKQGGSTITQQLIKNVTEDDDVRVDRKVREIFRALNLSRRYSREQILETYLNVVPLGNGTNGIQSAANLYFGKDAADLTLAESAAIVGITKYPGLYNPFTNPDKNKERQEHIIALMLEQGLISKQEHDEAVAQQLDFKGEEHFESIGHIQSYFIDHVVEEVIADLVEKKGYSRAHATNQIYQGGYRIYTTVDQKMQDDLEAFYLSPEKFPAVRNAEYPQSAATIITPDGQIKAIVGGIGEKKGNRVLNRASMSLRHPGSSIKPLAAYALAFEYNRVRWSTVIEDSPILLKEPGKEAREYPVNYYKTPPYLGPITVDEAIQRSTNTIPVKLVQAMGEGRVFDFLKNELNFYSLVDPTDRVLSSMALGGMTYGVTPLEMVGGYQIFVNGGLYTEPYAYTKVEDSNGRIILEADTTPRRVLSEDTAVILNRMLQRVTTGPYGTGRSAHLNNMPTGGKTGTSSNDVDQWFIGFTPYYIGQVWLGYDEALPENNYGTISYNQYPPPILFKQLMQPIHEGLEPASFMESADVVSMTYCLQSGDLATANCPNTAVGWYKKGNLPGSCTLHTGQSSGVGEENDDSDDDDDGGIEVNRD